jgi:hypothetical protein
MMRRIARAPSFIFLIDQVHHYSLLTTYKRKEEEEKKKDESFSHRHYYTRFKNAHTKKNLGTKK